MKVNKKIALALTGALAVAAGSANAAVDVTAVTAEITGASPAVVGIGSAVLVLIVGIKVYKYIRGAI